MSVQLNVKKYLICLLMEQMTMELTDVVAVAVPASVKLEQMMVFVIQRLMQDIDYTNTLVSKIYFEDKFRIEIIIYHKF